MTFDATASISYNFDQENRLTGAAGYTYTYDADGNRVRKSNGNLAANGTLYWYMTPGVVAESDLAGTLKSEYVFFDGERVARRDGATGAGGVFYYFSDHLKTASVITPGAANCSSSTTTPTTTNSPAKNAISRRGLIISVRGITPTVSDASSRRTGPPKQRLFRTQSLAIRNRSICTGM
jgi:hypothetical protein